MQRFILHIVKLSSLLLTLVYGCSNDPYARYQREFDDVLRKAIDSRVESVLLEDLTSFEWTEVCIALPYGMTAVPSVTPQMIDDKIPWASSEAYWGLVFLGKERKVVAALKIDRRVIDYAEGVENATCLMRNQARAVFLRNGTLRLELRQ